MKRKFPNLENRVKQEPIANLAISAVTVAELEYGIAKSQYPENQTVIVFIFSAFSNYSL